MSPWSSVQLLLRKGHLTGFSLFSSIISPSKQGATVVNFWFVANHGRGKGLGGKVTQLVSDLVVA
jgi:hypothetical protein